MQSANSYMQLEIRGRGCSYFLVS